MKIRCGKGFQKSIKPKEKKNTLSHVEESWRCSFWNVLNSGSDLGLVRRSRQDVDQNIKSGNGNIRSQNYFVPNEWPCKEHDNEYQLCLFKLPCDSYD